MNVVKVVTLLITYLQKYVLSKIKDGNVGNEAKILIKHISCDWKCKFNSLTCYLNKKWNKETCLCECNTFESYHMCLWKW